MEWLQYFHNIKVHHLTDTTLDHSPLLLAGTSTIGRRRNRRFHFEAIWTRRADCKEVIEEIWNDGANRSTPSELTEGLKQCAAALTNWSKAAFSRIPKKIKEKKEVLGELTKNDIDG